MNRTLDEMSTDERTLHLAVSLALAERPASERVVWVVDQFEEIFTLCDDEKERAQFLANLLYAAFIPGGRNAVVLTLRADFYQEVRRLPGTLRAHRGEPVPRQPDGRRELEAGD